MGVAEVVVVGGGGVPSLGEGEGSFCTFLLVLPFRRLLVRQGSYQACHSLRGQRVESRRLACMRGLVVQWLRRGS